MNKEGVTIKPIGTVVTINDAPTMYILISYYVMDTEKKEQYDYLACIYPLGFGNDLPQKFLNDKDIQYIIHEGLETNNFDNYIKLISEEIKDSNSGKSYFLMKEK